MSLRDVLVYSALIALALAGTRMGGLLASLITFLVFVVYSFRLIVAFIGSADDRLSAIGFVIPTTVYAAVLALVGSGEFSTTSPHLLTSKLAAMAVPMVKSNLTTTSEIMSLFHGIAIVLLGAIGSCFAQAIARARFPKNADQGNPDSRTCDTNDLRTP